MKKVLFEWARAKELIKTGYQLLDKEMTMAIPGPCFPAVGPETDTGIGSPYDKGAAAFEEFWDGVINKILLGPSGRTFPPFFSPYESALSENPFFIPLEKWTAADKGALLSKETLQKIWDIPKKEEEIFFPVVSRAYHEALREMYNNFRMLKKNKNPFAMKMAGQIRDFVKTNDVVNLEAKHHAPLDKERYFFESYLAYEAALTAPKKIPTIGDLQVKIPDAITLERPDLFLKDFTLGSPPDGYSDKNQDWFFKTFDPKFLFNHNGTLGEGGKILYQIFDLMCKLHKGGIRIDHFIGFVNPFVIPRKAGLKEGRLYSSPDNPRLRRYEKKTTEEFASITQKIILQALRDNKMNVDDLYVEDLGNRPEQLDEVLDLCGIGRMIVAEFVDIHDPEHPYQFTNARPKDIAALNTHDMPSIQTFFEQMPIEERRAHAEVMGQYLRFYYTEEMTNPLFLCRMKWGELMACPSKRVQAFFTSFTGQPGRYNDPENPKKWRLRCGYDFEDLYFKNLIAGRAFNPLDAIALAIFARGEPFFNQHRKFVDEIRVQEEALMKSIAEMYA